MISIDLLYSLRIPLRTITFRLSEEKLQTIDSIAKVQQQGRSFVMNEALTQYLSLHDSHRTLIEEGLRQDGAGEVIDHQTLMGYGGRLGAAGQSALTLADTLLTWLL